MVAIYHIQSVSNSFKLMVLGVVVLLVGCHETSYSVGVEGEHVSVYYDYVPGEVHSDYASFVEVDGYVVDATGYLVDEDWMYFIHYGIPNADWQWVGDHYMLDLSVDLDAQLVITDKYPCVGEYTLVLQLYTDSYDELEMPFYLSPEGGCHAHFYQHGYARF